ncbi:MAG: M23 family metallopeptidase [Spirochaetaceae bacterium]|jgi:murein DD-endopeptidase MepM/ murein hydrolase activator NlpD|nr:M23 family metallopeptidase [Spirochaetaceae bacterium]
MKKSPYSLLKVLLLLFAPPLFCAAAPAGCAAGSRAAGPSGEVPAASVSAGESAPAETAAPESAVAETAVPEAAAPAPEAAEAPARAAVLNAAPRLGEPFAVALALPPEPGRDSPPRAFLLDSAGRRTARATFFSIGANGAGAEVWAALLAVPSTMRGGEAAVRIEGLPAPGLEDIPITVGGREFVSETIDLDDLNTALRTEPDPRKTGEAEQLQTILRRTGTRIYAEGPFIPPVTSTRRTSFYGDRRVFRYTDGSTDNAIHAGVDYGIPTGTRVSACAPGRVVLARPRIVTGNSVVIEHLPGVYSLYYHLDSIAVREDDLVMAGTILGESGATGLATGPHLHWEVRVAGENTDPDALIARPLLDRNEIFAKLFE